MLRCICLISIAVALVAVEPLRAQVYGPSQKGTTAANPYALDTGTGNRYTENRYAEPPVNRYQPPPNNAQPVVNTYQPPANAYPPSNVYPPPGNTYPPSGNGYAPPMDGGYGLPMANGFAPPANRYQPPGAGQSPNIGQPSASGQPPIGMAAVPAGPAPVAAPAAFEQATLVAIVGNQYILAGDLLPTIDQMLEPYIVQTNQEQDPNRKKLMNEALDRQRHVYMKQMLTGVIENKLLYQEFLRSLPADKLDEAMVKIRKNLSDEYDKSELPKAMERAKVSTAAELDAKLRKYGSSLAKQKQTFMERQLGRAAVGRSVNTQPEITHTEQLNYYNQHADKYAIPSKARWEQMTVLFDKFPSKQAAFEAMARMGNEVYLGGAPFAAVAKRSSQSSNSEQGGYYDWTSQGSLRSEALDQAVFTLPLNQLSPIVEDDRGFHIVRVLERTQASSVPFEEAQEEIKSELKQQKLKTAIESYLEKTRENVYIWTMFDEEESAVSTANRSPVPASY